MLPLLARYAQRLLRPTPLQVWFDEAYRLPLPSLEASAGVEPRRVEFTAWFLVERRAIRPEQLRAPQVVDYEDILRVHDPDYIESLQRAETLAAIFGVHASEIPVNGMIRFFRLAAGATLEAARHALEHKAPTLNLSGGFHHAAPGHGGGFCAINDIAIAVAALRAEGFEGQINVLDLDAHPPDGTSLCLRDWPKVWLGSLSGSDWAALPSVDETVLREGTGDVAYLAALVQLLARMPTPELAFVIAGGDVLAGDRFGKLGLTLSGARQRDWLVHQALTGIPSVWMPGGGYHRHAWRVLAGTGLVLAGKAGKRIPRRYDPLTARLSHVAGTLSAEALRGDWELTLEDIEGDLGHGPASTPRLLGYYTAEGVEYALHQHGILGHIRRLGYDDLRVVLDAQQTGDRFRLFGRCNGSDHLLIEAELARHLAGGEEYLFVNWLTLRNPRARFTPERPQLPGQEVPGLGLGREATEVLRLIARRLSLSGVAFRPAWYHLAFAGSRKEFRFVEPERHGRFEALARDTAALSLAQATQAVTARRVLMNGEPYVWEASNMIARLAPQPPDAQWRRRADAERDRVRFTVLPPPAT